MHKLRTNYSTITQITITHKLRKLRTNYAQITHKLRRNYANIIQKLCTNDENYAKIMQKLCKMYVEIMHKLCENYANSVYYACRDYAKKTCRIFSRNYAVPGMHYYASITSMQKICKLDLLVCKFAKNMQTMQVSKNCSNYASLQKLF